MTLDHVSRSHRKAGSIRELRLVRGGLGLVAIAAAAGCGGGGGSGGGKTPALVLSFPRDGGLTDAGEIQIRGALSQAGVTGVLVNGAPAASSDGFATFSTLVPLVKGTNSFQIDVSAAGGEQRFVGSGRVVRTDPGVTNARSVAVDGARRRAALLDVQADAILLIDFVTGGRRIVAGASTGTGPDVSLADELAFDPTRDVLYASRSDFATLTADVVSIDLGSLDRAIVTGGAVGSGPALDDPRDLAIDPARDRLLVLDGGLDAVVAVDLATGDRAILADGNDGDVPAFTAPRGIAVDVVRDRAYLGDTGTDEIVSVRLSDGKRLLISGPTKGGGPSFSLADLDYAATLDAIAVADQSNDAFLLVHPTTGDRTILSDTTHGSGIFFDEPETVAVEDFAPVRLFGSHDDRTAVSAVDTRNGARTEAFRDRRGGGLLPTEISALAFDARSRRLIVAGQNSAEADVLFSVDPASGQRSLLSGAGAGSGVDLARVLEVVVDPDAREAYVVDAQARVLAVDFDSGAREVLAQPGDGLGPDLDLPRALALEPALGGLLAAGRERVWSIELLDRTRREVSGPGNTGPTFVDTSDLVVDAAGGRALLLESGGSILAVDHLGSGNRTLVSGAGRGVGPAIFLPVSLALVPGADAVFLSASTPDPGSPSRPLLLLVDLATGDRLVVSENRDVPPLQGPRVDEFDHLAIDDSGDQLGFTNRKLRTFYAVDPWTGTRVIVSE